EEALSACGNASLEESLSSGMPFGSVTKDHSMWLFALLLAEGQAEGPPGWTSWMPLVLIGVMFYFLLLLPMQRQKKQLQASLAALKKNDKVVTSGGIIGVVWSIKEKEDEVTLKIDESSNVRLR